MGFFNKKKSDRDAESPPSSEQSPVEAANEARAARRLAAYQHLGDVNDYVLAPIISSFLTGGGPRWPSREAHRVITTDDGHLIFVTDGLTDQFDDGSPGVGYEMMTKVPAPADWNDDFEGVAGMLEFGLQREMASNALATWPDLRPLITQNEAMSMVLPAQPGDSPYVSAHSNRGAEVGSLLTLTKIDDVDLVRITHILPSELIGLEAGGPETRPALFAALQQAGVGWTSNPNRAAVSS